MTAEIGFFSMIQKGEHQHGNYKVLTKKKEEKSPGCRSGTSWESPGFWVSYQSYWCPQRWWKLVPQYHWECTPRAWESQPAPLVPTPPTNILHSHEPVSLRASQTIATFACDTI